MATSDDTQAQLGVIGNHIRILKQDVGALKTASYVSGGAEFPGKCRWIETTTANTDAQQATAIRANLAE